MRRSGLARRDAASVRMAGKHWTSRKEYTYRQQRPGLLVSVKFKTGSGEMFRFKAAVPGHSHSETNSDVPP
jgi:hypothetical protein